MINQVDAVIDVRFDYMQAKNFLLQNDWSCWYGPNTFVHLRYGFEENQYSMLDALREEINYQSSAPKTKETIIIPKGEPVKEDAVNHPAHYTDGSIECIDAMQASLTPEEFRGALKANVLKYLWRSEHKGNRLGDYKKAQWYLNKLIEVTNV